MDSGVLAGFVKQQRSTIEDLGSLSKPQHSIHWQVMTSHDLQAKKQVMRQA